LYDSDIGDIQLAPEFVLRIPRMSVKQQNMVLLEYHDNDQHEVSSAPLPV
jgi:hypothetical protein